MKSETVVSLAKQKLDVLYKESLLLDGTLMAGGNGGDNNIGEIVTTATLKSSTMTAETPMANITTSSLAHIPAAPQLKKKKKRKSYKNMMTSMMLQQSPSKGGEDKDVAAIWKVTGGGVFSKIGKI